MHPARMRIGQARPITTEEALTRQQGDLYCRDCGEPCEKKRAIKSYRQSLKCPRCGGLLERRPHEGNGKAS